MDESSKITRKEVFAWCLYDFANSSYTTIIVTVAFSVFFTQVVVAGGAGNHGERLWGWSYSLSMLSVAIVAPLLGAIADSRGQKKKFLMGFTLLSITATALLFFTGAGTIFLAITLFTLSNIGFNGAVHFYNSFLIDISTRKNIGRISAYGWALGYVGGLISLLIVYPLIKDGFSQANLLNYRLSFPITAGFFLIFSIPAFLNLKERKNRRQTTAGNENPGSGFKRLSNTFHELKKFRELVKYFLCYLLYTDGINTVIVFSALFASKTLGFTPGELVIYFLITQVTAGLGALVSGPLTDRFGAKIIVSATLVVWIGISVAAYLVQTKTGFYIIGLVAGAGLGANQSTSRAMLGLFTPHGKNAEFFGFFSLVGKFAAVIGPILYGEVAASTGSQRLSVLMLGGFFLIGLIVLQTVNENKGKQAALEYEQRYLQN